MRKRLVVVGFSDSISVEIVRALANRLGWEPVYWLGKEADHKAFVNGNFKEVPYQPKSDALRKRFPDAINHGVWPIVDPAVVQELARYEPLLFPVFLRESKRHLGMAQCSEYHKCLSLWYHFFNAINPEVALFEGAPECVYDYLLYLLCKARGIPTLILLKQHQVPDLLIPSASLEEAPVTVGNSFEKIIDSGAYANVQLSDERERYLENMRGTYESAMYGKFSQKYAIDETKGKLRIKDTIARKLFDALRGKRKRVHRMELAMELWTYFSRLRLRRHYESRACDPNSGQPYVYVALGVQPEKTTAPLGGIFSHQLLMVGMLSRVIPERWLLYVKEHPSQLYYRAYSKLFRSTSFYDDLLEFPNVRLISSLTPSLPLIERARAVASANSTTCWEAVHRGVPSLVFGHAWFRDCEGVFYTPTQEACERAIKRLLEGYKVDQTKVRAYMHVLEREGLPNLIARPGHPLIKEGGQAKAIERFVEALCERLPPGIDGSNRREGIKRALA